MNWNQPHRWCWHFPYQFCSITIFILTARCWLFRSFISGFDFKIYLFTFGSSIEWKEKQKLFSKTLEMQIHCLSQCKTYLLSTTAGVKVHFPIFHLTAPPIQQITLLFFIWKGRKSRSIMQNLETSGLSTQMGKVEKILSENMYFPHLHFRA